MGGGEKTPEERAAALVAKFCDDAERYALGWNPLAGKGLEDDLRGLVADAIRAAERAATERAAKVAESAVACDHRGGFCECYSWHTLDEIAARIRGGRSVATITLYSHPRPDPDAPTPADLQAARALPPDKRAMLAAMPAATSPLPPLARRWPVDVAEELGWHPRRLYAVMSAWEAKGWCKWGVSHRYAWLTEKGRRVAESLGRGA